jgi:prepilin-type processing-associated H-X9-DG protein
VRDPSSPSLNYNSLVTLMAYSDNAALYEMYNKNAASSSYATTGTFQASPLGSGNDLLATQRPNIFRCPSDDGDPLLPWSTAGHYTIDPGNSTLLGVKTNYDFSVEYWDFRCNAWKNALPTAPFISRSQIKHMFGENSDARIGDVLDGTSNTIAMGETTLTCANGTTPAWAYRGWVQIGVDPAPQFHGGGINVWRSNWTNPPDVTRAQVPIRGKVGSWSWPGSLHPGGCHFTFADGSVRFIQEKTATDVMLRLAAMADGRAVLVP